MEIEEYRQHYLAELAESAQREGTTLSYQFASETLDELEEIGELMAPMPTPIVLSGRGGQLMAFDAYAYDTADASLVLISFDFNAIDSPDELPTLTQTRINTLCRRMTAFVEEAVVGNMRDYALNSPLAMQLAGEFRQKIGTLEGMHSSEVLRFKLYIITDATLSRRVRNVSQDDLLGRPVTLNIWTIERLLKSRLSGTSEIIEFDTQELGVAGVPYLRADLGPDTGYDAYLAIVPGKLLADLYLRYGSQLLQGNVRAFLSARGKVNKAIRNTIISEPANFFTYNNGIAVVARSIDIGPEGITHFKDFQIINGGQTTASLANAIIRKEAQGGMDNLLVPMKLTVLNVSDDLSPEQQDRYNDLTRTISKCANSQNTIKDADFFSNHPYHTLMEKLSKTVEAPAVNGRPRGSYWFYERSRGRWEQEQLKMTAAQRRAYEYEWPKRQVIKKERLAMCLNALYQKPHEVCRSSAKNFRCFASTIEDLYENHQADINEVYYKKAVCAYILFQTLDERIASADWYPRGGDKACITPYSIAKLMSLLPQDADLDWVTIWNRQDLYPQLTTELLKIARMTQTFLKDKAAGGLVARVAVNEETWEELRRRDYILSDDFRDTLRRKQETKVIESGARREQRQRQNIDNAVEVFKLGAKYWTDVYYAVKRERILSAGEEEMIRAVARQVGKGRLPTATQLKNLNRVLTKAVEAGYIMPAK